MTETSLENTELRLTSSETKLALQDLVHRPIDLGDVCLDNQSLNLTNLCLLSSEEMKNQLKLVNRERILSPQDGPEAFA